MTDVMSRRKRSALMSRIRAKDTGPERFLRAALRRARISYRSYGTVGGVSVDVVLPNRKVALLVHGCFWHGCPRHYTAPVENGAFWKAKLVENRARDRRQLRKIRAVGWMPVVIWEHSLREDPDRVLRSALMRVRRTKIS